MYRWQSQKPPGFRFFRLYRLTNITLTEVSQEGVRIDSGIMAIAPFELQGVAAHEIHVLQHDHYWYVLGL